MPSPSRHYRILTQIIALIALISLFAVATVGIHGMMGPNGSMESCPMMTETATLCPITLLTHLSQWQSLIRATLPALVLLSVVVLFLIQNLAAPVFWSDRHRTRGQLLNYATYRTSIRVFDRIMQAFSRGILQPKLFA